MYAIETDKLTKTYGTSRGITKLQLKVDQGDFFGFIGPNGAGKSTTIRTLLGLISPTGGSAKVLSYDIVTEKDNILENVGYLPSEINFSSGMKVKDIIHDHGLKIEYVIPGMVFMLNGIVAGDVKYSRKDIRA